MNETKSLLVGLTFNQDTNKPLLVVAAKSPLAKNVTPINIIDGDRALTLWNELTNKSKDKDK